MNKIGAVVVREIREALPATVFFLVLLHLIALTRAVALEDYSAAALRAAGATVGALIVAKAVLVVDALPLARLFSGRLLGQILWKALLYGLVVLLFKVAEEAIPLVARHGDVAQAARAMYREVSWPLFWILALWIGGGLLLYCLAAELTRALGPDRVRGVLVGPGRPEVSRVAKD